MFSLASQLALGSLSLSASRTPGRPPHLPEIHVASGDLNSGSPVSLLHSKCFNHWAIFPAHQEIFFVVVVCFQDRPSIIDQADLKLQAASASRYGD